MLRKTVIALLLLCVIGAVLPAQEAAEPQDPFTLFFPLGYDLLRLEEQTVHVPAFGAGFMLGEKDLPFTEVERRFFALALYQPFFFRETMTGLPNQFHQIDAIFDGRINRHQLLFIFKSAADKPVAGGLNTFQTGIGWGYEVIRRQWVSLILGAALCISDFGITLPSGTAWPVMPLPLIRFGIDTKWFSSSFEFLTGPNFDFTVAPEKRIRLTGDMRMDYYRNIEDLICEFTLWYRFFDKGHKLGDFAGIGAGFKNDILDFDLSGPENRAENFELLQRSVFAVLDLSILKVQGGWVFGSHYLVDGKKSGNPGSGFFLSVQGVVPVSIR